jgi:hypothetical protein
MPTSVQSRGDPILRRLPQGPAICVEVGVFVARLSTYLLRRHKLLRLVAVDDWRVADEQPAEYRDTGDRHALQTPDECMIFRRNAERALAPYSHRVTLLAMRSVDAAAKIRADSCDLIFLDGDHSEAGVAADLIAWEPKVTAGGFLGGHDYGHCSGAYAGVKIAVDQWSAANGHTVVRDNDNTWFVNL